MTLPVPPPGAGADVYGVNRPSLADARTALNAVYGERAAAALWPVLLERARLTGAETGSPALERLMEAMSGHHPVTALCARSLTIRLYSYQRLSAIDETDRSAE
ncbi:hypothetical protein [Planomonospora sp. ID82291]|uniref:hypothetical protein n=1 Tax=Planomonospora sp. ID82291 TaxID=2738136 RepID=UPI0018C39FA7|nr:hypothetical protein [Planomonospora sp. ID82291]MBG0818592.1 hypothetical protein [Planomonospora sp. ID82291]